MKKPRVLVLGGGYSPERAVSLRSAQSVIHALHDAGFHTDFYNPSYVLHYGPSTLFSAAHKSDVVFPILHGSGGEDGWIQHLLDEAGRPYLGSDAESSEKAFHKTTAKEIMRAAGVHVPDGGLVCFEQAEAFVTDHQQFVIKPNEGGSSIDTFVSRSLSPEPLSKARTLFQKYGELLVEELVEGIEITVPILGEKSLPPIAIVPPEGKEFDYENKYNGETNEICPIPETLLTNDLQLLARTVAERVHRALGARHLSRTDMFVSDEGEVTVLELNTMPGMTQQSLYPLSACVDGLPMPKLVTKFVEMALGETA